MTGLYVKILGVVAGSLPKPEKTSGRGFNSHKEW